MVGVTCGVSPNLTLLQVLSHQAMNQRAESNHQEPPERSFMFSSAPAPIVLGDGPHSPLSGERLRQSDTSTGGWM
jgi:hypothetical protein